MSANSLGKCVPEQAEYGTRAASLILLIATLVNGLAGTQPHTRARRKLRRAVRSGPAGTGSIISAAGCRGFGRFRGLTKFPVWRTVY